MASELEVFTPIDITAEWDWNDIIPHLAEGITPQILEQGICANERFSENTPMGNIFDCINAGHLIEAAKNGNFSATARQISTENLISRLRVDNGESLPVPVPELSTNAEYFARKLIDIIDRPEPTGNNRSFMEEYYPRWCESFSELTSVPLYDIASPFVPADDNHLTENQQCYNHIYNCLRYQEMINYLMIEPALDNYNGAAYRKFLTHIHYHLAEYYGVSNKGKKIILYYSFV